MMSSLYQAPIDVVGLPLDKMAATPIEEGEDCGDDSVVVLSEAARRGQAERQLVYDRLKACG